METMNKNTLYGYSSDLITLAEALKTCAKALTDGIGLLYSPTSCQFAKLSDGVLKNSQEQAIVLDSVFEARIFNSDYELRWLNEFGGKGQAVLISEQDVSQYWQTKTSLEYLDTISTTKYLIWGEKSDRDPSSGWRRLASARIGSLDIPLEQPITKKQRVYLNTCEYLAEVDKYGNVAVVEERLVKLEVK